MMHILLWRLQRFTHFLYVQKSNPNWIQKFSTQITKNLTVRSFLYFLYKVLKTRGAEKIYVVATHGLLSLDAPALLEASPIDEVLIRIIV